MSADQSTVISDLNSGEAAVRAVAAEKCAKNPELARAAAVGLVRCASDEDESTAQWASGALEDLGPPAAADAGALAELLNSEGDSAYWAATLLGRLEKAGKPYAGALAEIAAGKGPMNVREQAAWAISKQGQCDEAIRAKLKPLASSDSPRLARYVQKILG